MMASVRHVSGRISGTCSQLRSASRSLLALGRQAGWQGGRRGVAQSASVAPNDALPFIIETRGVPVHLYANPDSVEKEAIKQLIAIAESPIPVGFVAAMPDVHVGKGVTIGTVFASDKFVCPNAVGVDIGCGMLAVPVKGLNKDSLSVETLTKIQAIVKRVIPTGFEEHRSPLMGAKEALDAISGRHTPSEWLQKRFSDSKIACQLGTLGGGNHFLELVADEGGQVYILLHSGSRNIGNVTATHYDELASKYNAFGRKAGAPGVPKSDGINYLEIGSKEGQSYLGDMSWCQDYAMSNRQHMLHLMAEAVEEVTSHRPELSAAVNIHHNYCSCERCRYTDPRTGKVEEKDLYVTRKGATSARQGQLGIIPGSMGTGSYIVRGKGEANAWSSCSHGAGRRMSRTSAVKLISQEDFATSMEGIVADIDPLLRDEAPQAYKDLNQVMRDQADLVEVVHRLQPLLNVKGVGKAWGKNRSK